MEKKNMCFLCLVILELSTIHFVESLQISHNSSKIGLPSVIQCTSDNGNDMDWIVDGTTIATCLGATANSCLPPCTECSSVIASPATTFSYTISSVGYTNCIKYGCKERNTVFLSEFTLEVTEFSSDNTSLSPLEPTAGESGALNITTDCLFPASDESLTINWYKTYQDGNADEALGASFEIYNETQRSTCTNTCGNDTDAKMVIGCRYTPPSNPGTGFQIKVEVMHKAYTDTLNWTFNGTYYDEVQEMTSTSTAPAIVEDATIVTALLSGYLGWRLC